MPYYQRSFLVHGRRELPSCRPPLGASRASESWRASGYVEPIWLGCMGRRVRGAVRAFPWGCAPVCLLQETSSLRVASWGSGWGFHSC